MQGKYRFLTSWQTHFAIQKSLVAPVQFTTKIPPKFFGGGFKNLITLIGNIDKQDVVSDTKDTGYEIQQCIGRKNNGQAY